MSRQYNERITVEVPEGWKAILETVARREYTSVGAIGRKALEQNVPELREVTANGKA